MPLNKRINSIFTLVFILLVFSIFSVPSIAQGEKETKELEKTFTLISEVPRLPVISQGNTGTCWSFSTISFLESELIRMGKGEIDLSEMFVVYNCYIAKADYYLRMRGNNTFAQGGLQQDVISVLRKIGAAPASVYTGLWEGEERHNHGELSSVLSNYLTGLRSTRRAPSKKWLSGFTGILNAYLGTAPQKFEYKGKEMTPRSFADEVLGLNPDDYIEFTSYTHMPFYQQGELVIPDNWCHYDKYYNLPLDEFMMVYHDALDNGYSVAIATDVSEKKFLQKMGYAILEEEVDGKANITQEDREAMWDDWRTTDDHGMHAVGIAKDENGTTFYLVKNSWGVKDMGPYDGHIYMSEQFLRAKMHSFMVHKDAIPAGIRAKLNIE